LAGYGPSGDPGRLFSEVKKVVAATGVLAGKHRRALDSTVLDDAVATQDTITQLGPGCHGWIDGRENRCRAIVLRNHIFAHTGCKYWTTAGSVIVMTRGDASRRSPEEPGASADTGIAPGQNDRREILAQFEAAIAGMHTREIQAGLRQLLGTPDPPPPDGPQGAPDLDDVPGPVAELVVAVQTPSARRQMERLVSEAELQRPITIDAETAARMVRPYAWLLERAGHEGIPLTDAGHLPPDEVTAVIDALELGAGRTARPGAPIRRENQAPAIVRLRESAQATGLVRKQRGRLLRTATGDELHHDPAGLWWHLAARMPLRSAAVSEVQPGLILLTCVAARFTETLDLTIARMLTAIGWIHSDGGPVTGHQATRATSGTYAVLRRLGALHDPRRGHPPWPTPGGVAFARAALRTWPTPG
jgi:hypothetical protein